MPAVVFQLAFAGAAPRAAAAGPAAALAGQAFAQAREAGQPVAQQGELGLQLALVCDRAAAEDLENEHGAVEHLNAQSV